MLVFSNAGWQITDCTTVLDLVDPNTLELSSASTWDGTTAPHIASSKDEDTSYNVQAREGTVVEIAPNLDRVVSTNFNSIL
jgi:hypothetical protein